MVYVKTALFSSQLIVIALIFKLFILDLHSYCCKSSIHCCLMKTLISKILGSDRDISGVAETEVSVQPLLFIDTAGCDMHELDLPEEISKGNEGQLIGIMSSVGVNVLILYKSIFNVSECS